MPSPFLKKVIPLAVAFDIDCTLFDLRKPLFERVFSAFPLEETTVTDLLAQYHYVQHVPEWGNNPRVSSLLNELFAGDFMKQLRPFPGAREAVLAICRYARELHPKTPLCYATTRKESERNDTRELLSQNHFPDLELRMRPDHCPYRSGEEWKARELNRLHAEGKILLAIDDHPRLVSELRTLESTLPVILYGQTGEPSKQTVLCKDWKSAKTCALSLLDGSVAARRSSMR